MATFMQVDTITHTDQLYAMGAGSVVLDADGVAVQKKRHGWQKANGEADTWSAPALLEHSRTLRVLHWAAK